ncbi:BrnA antitoxin family protein [Bradyrhizobium sp. LTSP857]|uniref:BrnA antitoxin family protein n=1 Tax=Bradyrhizobium sp. LTSP857 TaxID=1619231 RepID=UPI0009E4B9C5|nr:BrnA antitoxin family protein [Bradyrhizobium sp. LTSP857]
MVSRKKIVDDPENPEWSAADFARAKSPEEVLSPDVLAVFGKKRGPQRAPKKVPVSIRLSKVVVTHFKEMGPGWQSKIDTTLKNIVMRARRGKRAVSRRPASSGKRAAGSR